MSFPGSYYLRRAANYLAPKAIILLYHRVASLPMDPQLLCVTPDHFADHMQILRNKYHPLGLMSLRRHQVINSWPDRSVVITFDDGYADNFLIARPILESHAIPATIFVSTGNLDCQQEFWWDELERIFIFTPTLPAQLEISIESKEYRWDLRGAETEYMPSDWNVLNKVAPTKRQQAYLDWMKILHTLDIDTRETLLVELAAWAGIDRTFGRQSNLSITSDELRSLPQDGLIEIGAHTVNHPVLSSLAPSVQRDEIIGSKLALEKILDRPMLSFSYPFGTRSDYTQETAKLVQECGFSIACSNFPGFVNWLSDPFQLPRFLVRDWDGETFSKKLEEWFGL